MPRCTCGCCCCWSRFTGATAAESFPYSGTLALLATASLAASGVMMTRFALWAERSPVHYMLYGSSFALGFGGLLLLELAMLREPAWLLPAGAVLASGALLSLRGLGGLYDWVRPSRRAPAGAALAGMVLSVTLMIGLSVLAP